MHVPKDDQTGEWGEAIHIQNLWFSGFLRRVVWWLDTIVSDDRPASIFRVDTRLILPKASEILVYLMIMF
jgi:hypothetical protein